MFYSPFKDKDRVERCPEQTVLAHLGQRPRKKVLQDGLKSPKKYIESVSEDALAKDVGHISFNLFYTPLFK